MEKTRPAVNRGKSGKGGWGRIVAGGWAAAMMLWGGGAEGMIMTSWQFPVNSGTPGPAAHGRAIALKVSEDGEGVEAVVPWRAPDGLYVAAKPGEGGAAAFGENPAGGAGNAMEMAAGAGFPFAAEDNAGNYDGMGTWGREDGTGTGWGRWITTGDGLSSRTIEDGQFVAGGAGGDGGTGRTFENGAQLDAGTFSVDARHDFTDSFSGFAVYGEDPEEGYRELLRFGVTTDGDGTGADFTGFCTAVYTGGQNRYAFFGDEAFADTAATVQYSLTWDVLDGGGLGFRVSAAGAGFSWASEWLELPDAKAVSAVGVLVAGNRAGETIAFDNVKVAGHAVPEPGTFSLLLLALPVLARRSRRKS